MSDGYVLPCGEMAGYCSAAGVGCECCGNNPGSVQDEEGKSCSTPG
jgi:hypothetical protein